MEQNNFLVVRKTKTTAAVPAPGPLATRVELTPEAMLGVVRKTGVVFFEWDLARGLTYLSESARGLLGYAHNELLADPTLAERVVQPAFRRQLTQFWARLQVEKPTSARIEIPFLSAGGQEVWLEARVVPQYDKEGRVRGLLGVALDATELVRSRAAADEGRQRYRLIFDAAPVPMLLVDPATLRVVDANDRGCRLLGATEEELVDTLLVEHVDHDERDRIESYFKSGEGDPNARHVPRTFFKRARGERFPVQIAAVNVWIEGHPRKLAVLRDLSDTESAEETLRSMRRAVEATDEAVVILDNAKRVVFANDASEAVFGRSVDELHGQDLAFLAEGGWKEEWERAVNMTNAGWLWRGVIMFTRTEPPPIELDVELVPVASPLGLVTHIVVVLRPQNDGPVDDSSRWRKSTSSALMLALLSRYVENALSSSRNRLGIMATSGELTQELRTELLTSTFQIDCAIEFTRFMREFHAADARPAAKAEDEMVGNLVAIVGEVADTVRVLSPVNIGPAGDDSPLGVAPVRDPCMVREVLLNLLCNAARGAEGVTEAPTVSLRGAILDGKQAFCVRIATPAGAGGLRGSGDAFEVGLALCHELVERGGGLLTVQDDPTTGATVYGVLFPAA
jgi:PAS domain S-box-containing protein